MGWEYEGEGKGQMGGKKTVQKKKRCKKGITSSREKTQTLIYLGRTSGSQNSIASKGGGKRNQGGREAKWCRLQDSVEGGMLGHCSRKKGKKCQGRDRAG